MIPILPENDYKDFVSLNGVMIDWERDSLPVRKEICQVSYQALVYVR